MHTRQFDPPCLDPTRKVSNKPQTDPSCTRAAAWRKVRVGCTPALASRGPLRCTLFNTEHLGRFLLAHSRAQARRVIVGRQAVLAV